MSRPKARREALERLTREWISLWCAPPDWALFDRLHADEFEDASPAGRGRTKRDFADGLAALVEAFPDLETRVEDLVVDEAASRVAVRWSAAGTNRGRFLGAGPSGRRVTLTGIEIVEFEGDRLRRRWGEWDVSEHLGRPS